MIAGASNKFRFYLERFILRGAHYRLLFIAAMVGLVSIVGGYLALQATAEFGSYSESMWWAFLRLTDPGYLGDDKGTGLRVLSTIITVLGYVIFMGSLIAIMTQWLNNTIRVLELGTTPIVQKGHVVILGWTNRTPIIVRELVRSEERLKRFLVKQGARKLRIVILAEEVNVQLRQDLQETLAEEWDERQIILRSGNPLKNEDLLRVAFLNAAAIIFPGMNFLEGGADAGDMRTVKALLSMQAFAEKGHNLPFLVTEIFDARKVVVARSAYSGRIEVIPSDSTISLLLAQNIRHQSLSHVFNELLTYGDGNELRIRHLSQFAGMTFEETFAAFPKAVPLGVLRPSNRGLDPHLNPPVGFVIREGDFLVLLARSHNDTAPSKRYDRVAQKRGHFVQFKHEKKHRRLLILGWSGMIPALVHELASYQDEKFEVDILSRVPEEEREDKLQKYSTAGQRVKLRHLIGDYGAPSDLEEVSPDMYDNILILGSDYFLTKEEVDARTILGLMLVRELLKGVTYKPDILVELVDPGNHSLFSRVSEEVIVSPMILSHMLAHIAMRPELNTVFQELFSSGGAEIYFRPMHEYGLAGKTMSFADIQDSVSARGEIALGVKVTAREKALGAEIELNPDKTASWSLTKDDEVVVLTTYV
ncbi:MAG: ion channel DMI1 [Desulfobulbaceae bacterium]|nr:MAG: ion channel DMI1 [Desulfobulbaceae bacterium]